MVSEGAMRAILVREPGDETVLAPGDAPRPTLEPADVREIKVEASLLTIAIVAAALATVYSFVCGVSSMAADGEVRHHTSEQWMIMRVVFQAVTVGLVLFAMFG